MDKQTRLLPLTRITDSCDLYCSSVPLQEFVCDSVTLMAVIHSSSQRCSRLISLTMEKVM